MNRTGFLAATGTALVAATLPIGALAAPINHEEYLRKEYPGISPWMIDRFHEQVASISFGGDIIPPMPQPQYFMMKSINGKSKLITWNFTTDRQGMWRITRWDYVYMWYQQPHENHFDAWYPSHHEVKQAQIYQHELKLNGKLKIVHLERVGDENLAGPPGNCESFRRIAYTRPYRMNLLSNWSIKHEAD